MMSREDTIKEVFLIEHAWSDPLENQSSAAFGYEPIGIVFSHKQAVEMCSASRVISKETHGWAAWGGRELRFRRIGVL